MKLLHAALLLLSLVVIVGCGGSPAPAPAPAPAPKATPAPAAATPKAPVTMPDGVPTDIPNSPLIVTIVDLQGKPLPELAAIVTEDANAFEKPLVRGSISNADGRSELLIPRDRLTYVRGWDPKLDYFANSFLTIQPGDAPLPADSTVIMVPAAQFSAQVYGLDGAPLPLGTRVEVLFSHPTQGPWWPARAEVDEQGRLTLPKVPAGQFNLDFRTEAHGTGTIMKQLLPPSTLTDAGLLHLQ